MAQPIEISENVTRALARAQEAATDLTPAMAEIARSLATQTRFRFRNQRGPDGVPWKQSQRARDEGGLTLVDSGDLFSSIAANWGKDFAEAGPEASGGAAIYAAVHQWGARIAAKTAKALKTPFGPPSSVNIPARPYLGFNQESEDSIVAILSDHVKRAFNADASPNKATGA